ncbi:hypothetical protein [Ferrovibrio xuzhouensis]|uniref:Uncharacterized protein n=1 Tax=Ferrovibrio xuzhouensis TaxID=1576914 RepID=A0ABV7VJN7_9PROT
MKQRLVMLTVLKSKPEGLSDGSFVSLLLPGTVQELRDHFRACLSMDAAAGQGRPGITSYVIAVAGVRPPTQTMLKRFAKLVADSRLQAWDSFNIEAPVDLARYIGRVDRLSRDLHFAGKARASEPLPSADIIPLRRI